MNKERKINKVKDHGFFFVPQKRTVGRLTFPVISRPGIGKRHVELKWIKMRDSLISFISCSLLSPGLCKYEWWDFCLLKTQRNLKAGLYDEIFFSRPWNFYVERKVSKYFRKRNVCREILFSLFTQSSFIHTIIITFHS